MPVVGLLHPGAMGASVGAALVASGHRVLWAKDGRSAATAERAELAALIARPDLPALVAEVEWIVSVCPPGAALEQARRVAGLGFGGLYLDANAVAPATAREIAAVVEAAGARFVDGGIVGPPAWRAGATRLHLSGEGAEGVAEAFAGGNLGTRVVPGGAGAASALKMAYASWTKGTAALLANLWALARAEGVDEALLAEWETSVPDLPARVQASLPGVAPKAWRFADEMREIAATYEAADLPGGFHRAAAEVYERLAALKDADPPPPADEVADRLRKAR